MDNDYYDPDSENKDSSNLAFALAREVQRYVEINADSLDRDTWDNIQYWRSGILSQRTVTEENIAEIIDYLGVETIQELIAIASNS